MQKLFGALDLGGSFLKYAYGNKAKGIVFHDRIAIAKPDNNEHIFGVISEAIRIIKEKEPKIEYFGMGTPGTVNVERGVVTGVTPNLPNIVNIEMKKEIEKRNNIKVHIENDANIMCYAEASKHADQNVLGITIGTGIGSGFVYNNEIYHGQNHSALELGHTIVNINGRKCKCGKIGCAEAYCSANSMLAICNESFPELEIKSIADLLDLTNVNSKVHRKVEELLTYLGVTIANAITILDPHVVCIGGGVVDIPNFDFSFLQNIIKEYLAINYQGTLITKANFGNQAGIYGGILIAEIKYLEHFLLDK